MLQTRLARIGLILSLPFLLVISTPSVLAVDAATPSPSASPTDSVTPSPTPSPSSSVLPPLILPATIDRPVPTSLKPSLANAKSDRPKPYPDHCHTQQNLTASTATCIYGNKTSKTTIVLFGDSHALSWFPAVEKLALAKKWRLYSLTMSSCWPADIPAWNSTTLKLMTNCTIWRANTLKQIAKIRPAIVFISGTRGFATIGANSMVLKGDDRTNAWQAGMKRTLDLLKASAKRVVLISDIPASSFDPPQCLLAHRKSILACSTPIKNAISTTWLALEQKASNDEGITYVDPTLWICSTDPCPPIAGNTLIYIDGGHMSATFALTLEAPLWKEISSAPHS